MVRRLRSGQELASLLSQISVFCPINREDILEMLKVKNWQSVTRILSQPMLEPLVARHCRDYLLDKVDTYFDPDYPPIWMTSSDWPKAARAMRSVLYHQINRVLEPPMNPLHNRLSRRHG